MARCRRLRRALRPRRRPVGRTRVTPALPEDAVTPVLGSILVLGISVVGIAAILLWGAPAIQSIQDQNAQVAMVGEFQDLRLSSLALSVPDASRTPVVVMQDGELSVTEGTRFLVAAGLDAAHPDCDMQLSEWDSGAADTFTLATGAAGDCRTPRATADCLPPMPAGEACLQVFSIKGSSRIPLPTVTLSGSGPWTVTVSGSPTPDLHQGNWEVALTNGETTTPVIYARAIIISSMMHEWDLRDTRAVFHDGGAVFSRTQGAYFIEAPPALREDALGTGEHVFWLRSFTSASPSSVSGRDDYTVTLALVGSHVRVDDTAHLVRYSFSGTLAEPWCTMLLARNDDLPAAAYSTASCTDAVPSVLYDTGTSFPFRFLDAQIETKIQF